MNSRKPDSSAYVYAWRNIYTGKVYIGYRKKEDVQDGYKFSSEDEELLKDWSLGHLERVVLFRGAQEVAITLESFLLKRVNADKNPKYYNRSLGGGPNIKDLSTLTEEQKRPAIQWLEEGIIPEVQEPEIFNQVVGDLKLVESVLAAVKGRKIQTQEIAVDELDSYARNQVRKTKIDPNHVKELAEVLQDPAEARKYVQIVVSVDGENKTIIDGNHTTEAVKKAGWKYAPVTFINSSEFNNEKANIDLFGQLANNTPFKKSGNKNEDCSFAIVRTYENILASLGKSVEDDENNGFEVLDGKRFKDTCMTQLKPLYPGSVILGQHKKAIHQIKNDYAAARHNFQKYEKVEGDRVESALRKLYKNTATIVISSGSVYNGGIGGIMNKMNGEKVKKGIIITHHSKYQDQLIESVHLKKLKGTIEMLDSSYSVRLIVLESFMEDKDAYLRRIIADPSSLPFRELEEI